MTALTSKVIETCRQIAACSEEPGRTTRTFLSPPMRQVHRILGAWMESLGMEVRIDSAGNLRGSTRAPGARLVIGSHLDTVPNAGAFDGILGVVAGIALVEMLGADQSPAIEVIGFSEEEGVRFGIPFIGSRAVAGTLDEETLDRGIGDAIREYGLDPAQLGDARLTSDAAAYLEIHIEQGPVLEEMNMPLAVVERIMGQSRLALSFRGQANHAGTTPFGSRRDALAGAAEWILSVEALAASDSGLRATVGSIQAEPNAGNVIAGSARVSLDVRHGCDEQRRGAVEKLLEAAREIAHRRKLALDSTTLLDQPAVLLDSALTDRLADAVVSTGYPLHRMASGAGHDAMILAPLLPSTMLFLRSPAGLSHHPDETVIPEDVDAALQAGAAFIRKRGDGCV